MSKLRPFTLAAFAFGALVAGAPRGLPTTMVTARRPAAIAPERVAAPASVPPATSLTTIGAVVTQNFDTLANSGTSSLTPNGWDFAEAGTNANLLYTAGTGSGTAGDTYSFGAAASTERAFGGLQSGSLIPTIGAAFTNNTGVTIASLAIGYTGEQWRLGALGRTDRIDFQYSLDATSLTTGTWTDVDSLDFTAPVTAGTVGALDGNAAANRTLVSSSIAGLTLANGATIWIRWTDLNATGSDDGLAVDDFSLTPAAAPTSTPTVNASKTPTPLPSATPTNTALPTSTATATPTVAAMADLATTKTDAPDPVIAGNNLTYSIVTTNNGPSDAQGVTLSDPLPAGTTFVSAVASAGGVLTTPAVGANGTVSSVWAGATAATVQRTLTITVRVLPSVAGGTVLSNTATATSSTPDPTPANNAATATTTVAAQADLAASKTDTPDPAIAGATLSYALTSTNNGPSDAQTVVIADTIPATTRFVSATPSAGGSCVTPAVNGSGTVTCTFAGATAPTAARSVTIVVRPCAEIACNTVVANTGATSSATTDPAAANNSAAASTTIQSQADTAITLLDAPEPVVAGTDLTYTSVVTNNGPSNAVNTLAMYTLDSRLAFVSATVAPAGPTCNAVGQTVTCSFGTLGAANQCATAFPAGYTVTLVATVSDLTACSSAVCPGSPGVPLASSAVVSNADCLADPAAANNTAAQSTTVRAGADVVIDDPTIEHIASAAMAALAAPGEDPTADADADAASSIESLGAAALSPRQDGADCVAVGDYLVVTQTFGNTGPLAFTRQRDNAGPEWETALPPTVIGQACRVASGGGTCAFTATQLTWDGAIDVGQSVTLVYSVRIKGATPSGTAISFDGTVHYDGFNIQQNTFNRVSGAAVTSLDCPSIIDPNTQLGNAVQLPILAYEGQDDVCDSWIEVQNLGCSDAVAAMVAWGEPGFCPPQATGPLKVECSGVLKPGSAWVLAGAQVPTGAKSGIVFKFSGNPLLEDGIDIGVDDITGFYMCELLFFGVVGDADDYRRFKKAYDEGLEFQGVDLRRAVPAGGALAVDVVRFCPGDATPAVSVTSKYNGIAGTHLGVYDDVFGGYSFFVPLVYAAKGGYNSILYIQNGGLACSSVEIWFQQQEACLRATLCDIATLAPGESYQLDASDCVGPDFQGSAWIRATQQAGIVVDIIGHDLLMTYVGEPAELNYSFNPRKATYTAGNQVGFAPLVYSEYQGWDSAIQVQNLSPLVAAKVKVYFLDRSGDIVTTLIDWVCPRGSQTFFLPLVANLPGNWVGSARVESQEWIAPGSPNVLAPNVVAVATLTEYSDAARTTATQGIAYNLLPEHKVFDWQIGERGAGDFESGVALIAIPGVLKDLGGDSKQTTEIAIANVVPKPGFTDLVIYIYDQNGLIDYVCQKLNEKQVEYIDVQTWGWLHAGFRGSAIISAWFWEHEVTDGDGFYLRNLVGLAAMSITRHGGRQGEDLPGDEAAGERGIPFENTFDANGRPLFQYCFLGPLPLCAGFADLRPTACEVHQETFACANCPVTIPGSGQAPPAIANVVGHANCTVADVDIAIDITHNWIGDLDIDVSSPHTAKVPVIRDICDTGAVSGLRTILDSDAASPVGSVCPPAPFAHAQPGGGGGAAAAGAVDPRALDVFDGVSPTGRWTLDVFNDFTSSPGTIDNWAVNITYR